MSKKPANQRLMVCNCQKTMELDGAALARALGSDEPLIVHNELCRGGIGAFERALADSTAGNQPAGLHVACTQEAPLFSELAEEKGQGNIELAFTNIRERAGWCADKSATGPKIAALLADGSWRSEPAKVTTIESNGVCLVYGAGQEAFDVARKLSAHLSVTLLLSDTSNVQPPSMVTVPVNRGRITSLKGALGNFELTIDGYAPMLPSSRAELDFAMARDGARSQCDLIFDMSGSTALVSAPDHRDGYFRVDPDHPAAVASAMFEIIDYVGEFEKPLYVSYQADICAHARAGQVGCSNCLDNCPAGAISPADDHIKLDPAICAGCGSCSALCPTGAISYAYPQRGDLIRRTQALLRNFLNAGGARPSLLLHNESHGDEMISTIARHGRGLPANMLPLPVYSLFHLGHDILTAMLSAGAAHIALLVPPDKQDDLPSLENQVALTAAFLDALGFDGKRLHIVTETDPDQVETVLYDLPDLEPLTASAFDPVGSKRDVARAALAKLHAAASSPADIINLPDGAPYGIIELHKGTCTLCLSCIGACPAGALADNPERPEISFTEAACVQCGVCVATCPENAIALKPRYNFLPEALNRTLMHFEEPFDCIVCGKPFGTKSSIELIMGKLKDHPMFAEGDQIKLIQMCDDCRIITQANSNNDPFSAGARPRMRTTDDYVNEQAGGKKKLKDPDDFLS